MPMVAESTFELEFSRIAADEMDFKLQIRRPSELHSSCFITKTKTSCYFAVAFACTVQRFTKIFSRSNNIRRLKNGFFWLQVFFKPRPKIHEIAF